jgi:hypothetical protein
MIDFVSFLSETFSDWPLGTVVIMLLGLVTLGVIFGVLYAIFRTVDSWFLVPQRAKGEVTAQHHTPFSVQSILVGEAITLVPIPESWSVTVQVAKGNGNVSVTKRAYSQLPQGRLVEVSYVVGRISGSVYIREIYV